MNKKELQSAGLCTICAKNKLDTKVACRECADRNSLLKREKRKYLTENNLCNICGKNEIIENKRHCEECCNKKRKQKDNREEGRLSIGVCVNCGIKPLYSKRLCKECLNKSNCKQNLLVKKYANENRCWWCKGVKNNNYIYCNGCLAKRKEKEQKNKDKVFMAYGGYVCSCCGEKEKAFLSIDHINNDGAQHRRSVNNIINWLIKNNFPEGFQVLCMNCQFGKLKCGICPHRQIFSKNIGGR